MSFSAPPVLLLADPKLSAPPAPRVAPTATGQGSAATAAWRMVHHVQQAPLEWLKVYAGGATGESRKVELCTAGGMWHRLERLGLIGFPRSDFGKKGTYSFMARTRAAPEPGSRECKPAPAVHHRSHPMAVRRPGVGRPIPIR